VEHCVKSVINHVLDPDAFVTLDVVFKGKAVILTVGYLFSEVPLSLVDLTDGVGELSSVDDSPINRINALSKVLLSFYERIDPVLMRDKL
jgi:hypothetical protein